MNSHQNTSQPPFPPQPQSQEQREQRHNEEMLQLYKQLAEERKRLEEERKRLAEERKRLEEERKRLEEGRKRLEEGRKRLEEGRKRLEEGRKRLDDECKRLAEAYKQQAEAYKQLDDERKQLDDERKLSAERLAEAYKQLDEERKRVGKAPTQLAEARKQVAEEGAELPAKGKPLQEQMAALPASDAATPQRESGSRVQTFSARKAEMRMAENNGWWTLQNARNDRVLEEKTHLPQHYVHAELNSVLTDVNLRKQINETVNSIRTTPAVIEELQKLGRTDNEKVVVKALSPVFEYLNKMQGGQRWTDMRNPFRWMDHVLGDDCLFLYNKAGSVNIQRDRYFSDLQQYGEKLKDRCPRPRRTVLVCNGRQIVLYGEYIEHRVQMLVMSKPLGLLSQDYQPLPEDESVSVTMASLDGLQLLAAMTLVDPARWRGPRFALQRHFGIIMTDDDISHKPVSYGGTCIIYKAYHHALVAIKCAATDSGQLDDASFADEARVMGKIRAARGNNNLQALPPIDSVLPDVIEINSRTLLVSPWGEANLKKWRDDLCLPFDVVSALYYGHRARYLHRDVRTANMIKADNHVMLIDWGFAVLLDENGEYWGEYCGAVENAAVEVHLQLAKDIRTEIRMSFKDDLRSLVLAVLQLRCFPDEDVRADGHSALASFWCQKLKKHKAFGDIYYDTIGKMQFADWKSYRALGYKLQQMWKAK